MTQPLSKVSARSPPRDFTALLAARLAGGVARPRRRLARYRAVMDELIAHRKIVVRDPRGAANDRLQPDLVDLAVDEVRVRDPDRGVVIRADQHRVLAV